MSIQFKRGTHAQRTSSEETGDGILKNGQPFYETDTSKLYIGNGNDKLRDLKNNFAMLNDSNLFVGDQTFDNEDHTSYIGLKLNNECSLAVGINEDIKLDGSKGKISIGNDLSITSKNIQMYLPTGVPMLNIEPSNSLLELGAISTSTSGIKINTDGFDVYKNLGAHTRYGLNSIDKYFLDGTGSTQITQTYFLPSGSGILALQSDLPTYYIHNVFLTYSQPNVSTQTLTKAKVAISVISTSGTVISTVTDLVNSINNKTTYYYRCSGYYKIGSATAVDVHWMNINKNQTNNITLMDADMNSSTKLLLDNDFITLSGQDYVTQIL